MDWTVIIAAAIAAGPVYLGLRKNNKLAQKSHAILQGNGKGTVDKMLEEVLEWQGTHAIEDEARFARLEGALRGAARKAATNDTDARDARG